MGCCVLPSAVVGESGFVLVKLGGRFQFNTDVPLSLTDCSDRDKQSGFVMCTEI